MKKTLLFSLLTVIGLLSVQAQKTKPAMEVIQRVTNQTDLPVSLKLKKEKGNTYFQYKVKNGILKIQASDNVALCRGFYDFIKKNKSGVYTWSGHNIHFPDMSQPTNLEKVISPFANHYYFNVCTFGYSMPYWDWNRWEQEIDWMAVHGINMPLALVGYEAIIARVWKKMGLTDEEINNYFVGPAHLPWMRMGNISGIDGPLNNDWHKDQVAMQHKILKRMKSLGMKPICPGFPGFIPESFKRIYPNLKIQKTFWGGAFNNWMISLDEPLFTEISKNFIQEWEKEFGKNHYYLVDSFNEMEIPFPKKGNPKRYEMAAHYGEKVYEGIKAANPNAVWVMQGWMFGYQRHIWDYKTLGALVSKVPDNKMLLLDLAVDYNKNFWHSEVNWEYYKGFYNKQWVYSVIPNMGGKTGMTGLFEFYANGHLEALNSPNRGNLIAHGMAPEGIENNDVLYELITDAGWSNKHIDVKKWVENYCRSRYGKMPKSLTTAWDYLLKSVYGTFTDHPRFNWQLRPGNAKNGSINICDDYFKGLEAFVDAADELGDQPLYKTDLAEMTMHYASGKAEILTKLIDQELLLGDTLQARYLQGRFETLLLGIDAILGQHPTLRLDRWVNFAKKHAVNPEQEHQYATNARRIVTVWGPPVDDYSARIWSGLVGTYYLGRWKHYYESRLTGKPFDMAKWELDWVEGKIPSSYTPEPINVVSFARNLMNLSKDISSKDLKLNKPGMLGTWNIKSNDSQTITFTVPAHQLKSLKNICLEIIKGNEVKCTGFTLEADGTVIASSDQLHKTTKGQLNYAISLPTNVKANNGCTLKIHLKSSLQAAGIVYLQ